MKKTDPKDIEHGTYAGGKLCYKAYGKRCDDCKRANREYMQKRREDNPDWYRKSREQDVQRAAIRSRALKILIDRHRAEYFQIHQQLTQEMKEGSK